MSQTKFGALLFGSAGDFISSFEDEKIVSHMTAGLDHNDFQTHTCAINLGFALNCSENDSILPNVSDNYSLAVRNVDLNSIDQSPENVLEQTCSYHLNKEINTDDTDCEENKKLVNYLIKEFSQAPDCRIILPLLWNSKSKHLLAQNFYLSKKILNSNLQRNLKNANNLQLIDNSIKELENLKIIERIPNLEQFMIENPTCCFLPHTSILKPNNETTKVRTVFMSNLADKNKGNFSNNKCLLAGPCINQKLTTSLILLRFDKKLLCFDIVKAFCQILLPESDQNKLLFCGIKMSLKATMTS